jgi:hypothetical protein
MSSQIAGKAILASNYGQSVNRAAAVLPATGNQTLFNVTGGRVLVTGIVGEVTTVMSATVTNIKLTTVSTVGSVATDLCANTAVTSLAVGNLFSPGTLSAATAGVVGSAVIQPNELYVQPGIIRVTTDATNTGAMRWQVLYIPIDPGAAVTAA